MILNEKLLTQFDPIDGTIQGYPVVERRLSQLRGVFGDTQAFEEALAEQGDALVYSVTSVEPAEGKGQLHYGIGKIMPGRIGQEYFMTRGHFHEWRIAAEVYIGLNGIGLMLLEDDSGQNVRTLELSANSIIYVPGHTAHRTINIGESPLIYLGIYPADAGHDYGALKERNFSQVVITQHGEPVLLDREIFLASLV